MNFIETRGNDGVKAKEVSFSSAIKSPSASFGGLYVPASFPVLDSSFVEANLNSSYKELAFNILKLFKLDINILVLKTALELYNNFDSSTDPVPLVKVKENLFVNELYHGPTRAFKDMALQPFGHIFSHVAKSENKNFLILAATSGDTGPATLNTFEGKSNVKVACLYPDGGTSDVQRLQMTTTTASNEKVIGVHGNFDDTQNRLKELLKDESFKKELENNNVDLSAANSVNFGRIIFQIIYHVHAYIRLFKDGVISKEDSINIIVPSGNFGNALGAYYAKKMGIKIDKIISASNENNVLFELIENGKYDLRDKKLIATSSPAMDILKSSNVERILYDKFGSVRVKELMQELENDGFYQLTPSELKVLQEDFKAVFSDDAYGKKTIKKYVDEEDYLMDPHTATAIKAYEEFNDRKSIFVACSTAEWTKFAPTVLNALNENEKVYTDKEALDAISKKLNVSINKNIEDVFLKDEIQNTIVEKGEILSTVLDFVKQ